MSMVFAETLKKLRIEKGLSQRELAERLYVTRPTVARWENGSRLPDAAMISRLSQTLGIDVNTLLNIAVKSDEAPNIILVDDRKLAVSGALQVLEEVLPQAVVAGFTKPSEALEYARTNPIVMAFLDIELGKSNGFELCRELLELNPRTNVVFLTAYIGYSFDAWSTGASGFMLKPLTADGVRAQLKNLRFPFLAGNAAENG